MMAAWALATPLGGGVDEPSHMIRAESVARGDLLTDLDDGRENLVYDVSPGVSSMWDQLCFLYDPTLSPACAPDISTDRGPLSPAATGAGRYNPVPYVIVGWTVIALPGENGLYLMRLVQAGLCAALLGAAAWAISQAERLPAMRTALVWGLTPMVAAIGGVVNPNALEVAAGVALFCSTLSHVLDPLRHGGRARIGIVVVAGFLLANARSLSPLWLLILGLAALAFCTPESWRILIRLRSTYVAVAGCVLSATAATAWALYARPLTASTPHEGAGTSFEHGFLATLARTPKYAPQWVGVFGWGRIPLPAIVLFGVGVVLCAIVIAAVLAGTRRGKASVVLLIASLVLIPAVIQGASAETYGFIWQGRYTLVLIPPIAIAAARALSSPGSVRIDKGTASRAARWSLALQVPLHTLSIAVMLRGYEGQRSSWRELLTSPPWAPPGGTFVWIGIIAIGATIVTLGLVAPLMLRKDQKTDSPPPSSPSPNRSNDAPGHAGRDLR